MNEFISRYPDEIYDFVDACAEGEHDLTVLTKYAKSDYFTSLIPSRTPLSEFFLYVYMTTVASHLYDRLGLVTLY